MANPNPPVEAARPRYVNQLQQRLQAGQFVLTLESPPLSGSKPLGEVADSVIRMGRWARQDGWIAALTISDRVRTDRDHDALLVGRMVADTTGVLPLVHWAGKGRTLPDLERDLERARQEGMEAFLFITGDALREPPPDRPARYMDSVQSLWIARKTLPSAFLAAAVNPFKYREEELLGQYVKALKKLRAGADVLITQIGWDPRKFQELQTFLASRGLRVPVLASVWLLTPSLAMRIREVKLPGVPIPQDFLRRLEEDAKAEDGGRAIAIRRAALQVVGARLLGYAGAHLCGVHAERTLEQILDQVVALEASCPDLESWLAAWYEVMAHPDGRPVRLAPEGAFYLDRGQGPVEASPAEVRGFRILETIDRWMFQPASPVARVGATLLRPVSRQSTAGRVLARVEHALKGPWVGCQLCGFCRLPYTFFVCPETCPKGLSNGPCGGTDGNTCEFGDRECIHARIYRLAKHTGQLEKWEQTWVPPVPEEVRGTCSWIGHFQKEEPEVEVLPPAPGAQERPAPAPPGPVPVPGGSFPFPEDT
ncbi:MAG: methylenetetrahydrofolate reductase C-terminal domain-containing protein [Armatimonadota bacterium]|nr:methylenetetrahydrofolate reductase C-terminal domain-containing protein [Armatimonadota bacterium]MDR7563438.1 methylenetetrahydrofolate reductase C-terminal domain-containing protein [Armatimonadota bacterium]MDR7567466.1 methylenetetrahydrofolate reductase C-terminal domain-containing protein [Armatimonadota bacterium]MDR7601276.1 methylenetetrahydrofolate reductase C-terminal domain-containing protein [Armatimonadota bacterium]